MSNRGGSATLRSPRHTRPKDSRARCCASILAGRSARAAIRRHGCVSRGWLRYRWPVAPSLDFGCGSGILAIAARLLGARSATAVDRDPEALAVASRNAARNGVSLDLARSEAFEPDGPFDLVVANIVAGTLADEAPRLRASVAPGGRLALCGLLAGQVPEVAAAYPDVCFDAARVMDGWALLGGRRPSRPVGV